MKPRVIDPKRARQHFEDKTSFTTGPVELDRWMKQKEDIVIVDVRRGADYDEGHVPGAVSLPKEKWDTAEGLRQDKVNVLYCYSQVCHLAAEAALSLASRGYPVIELEGGFAGWKEHGLPVKSLVAQRPS